MTSQIPLFWRAFILLIFGPKVQAEVTFLQALKIAKVNEKIMTFLKLIGPCKKQKYFFIEIFIYLSCRICELKLIFLNNWQQSLQDPISLINVVTCSSILTILKA